MLSIVPDGSKHSDPEAMERLRNFHHVYERTQLSEERFLEEMDTVSIAHGLQLTHLMRSLGCKCDEHYRFRQ